jgi:hypothetical protein
MSSDTLEGAYIPETLGACADLLYDLRKSRFAKQREIDYLEDWEKSLKAHIIDTLPKSDMTGVSGRNAKVSILVKEVPQIEDWGKFTDYVSANGAFDLLQKRANELAVRERWQDGSDVPGLVKFNAVTVSVTKVS